MPEWERIYQEIYIKHSRSVFNLLLRNTISEADAEDIKQEVFAVFLLKMGPFLKDYPNNSKQIKTFLFRTANNLLLHYWRDHQKILNTEVSMELLPDLADPRSSFSHSEFSLPKDLSELDRKLLRLRQEGYSLKEIADQLGISHDACRMRSSRLDRKLKDFLEREK